MSVFMQRLGSINLAGHSVFGASEAHRTALQDASSERGGHNAMQFHLFFDERASC